MYALQQQLHVLLVQEPVACIYDMISAKSESVHLYLTLHRPHHLVGVCHGVGLSREILLPQQPPLLGREVALPPRKRLSTNETPVTPQSLRPRQGLPARNKMK